MQYQDIKNGRFYLGDCLEVMKEIPDGTIDMILCDLPYGTTACKWDTIIPFEPLWSEYKRVIKRNGAIVLTAQNPFTSALIMSQTNLYRYNWIWDKGYSTGFANANKMPLKGFEDVCVFYKHLPTYNPQGLIAVPPKIKRRSKGGAGEVMGQNGTEGKEYVSNKTNYPKGFISTSREHGTLHPTQKPVALFEYLIKTYTNEGDLVLDNAAGSGTAAIAAENINRKWICIEQSEEYTTKAVERIQNHQHRGNDHDR